MPMSFVVSCQQLWVLSAPGVSLTGPAAWWHAPCCHTWILTDAGLLLLMGMQALSHGSWFSQLKGRAATPHITAAGRHRYTAWLLARHSSTGCVSPEAADGGLGMWIM